MQPPLFRGQHGLTITNISGTGRWNYLVLDKLQHRKLSLVCLGFTPINVPPMLKCPSPSEFMHVQMSGVTFGGHVPRVLCCVPWLGDSGEGTGVCSYTGVLYSGVMNSSSHSFKHKVSISILLSIVFVARHFKNKFLFVL